MMQYGKKYHIEVKTHVAGAVIFNRRNQVLLVQESEGSKKDLWHVPSGTVEHHELPQEAAVREIEEETGLKLSLRKYLNTYAGYLDDGSIVLRHVWLTGYFGGQVISPNCTKEINDARFFSKTEVETMYDQNILRMYHTLLMIKDAYSTSNW